jgi:2-dehydropantoate 2-reductase
VTDDPAQAGVVDAIFVCVKTSQVLETARAMRPTIGAQTVVVPLQNGVEAAAQLGVVLGGLCGALTSSGSPRAAHSRFAPPSTRSARRQGASATSA